MKKILAILLCLIISLSAVSPAIASANIKVVIDNKQIAFDVQPVEINGRVMVPIRAIFEALGATVDYDDDRKTVISRKDDRIIVMQIGNNVMFVDNAPITLDVAAIETGGRVLVPVRAVSEAFGCAVDWNETRQTVTIYSSSNNASANKNGSDKATASANSGKISLSSLSIKEREKVTAYFGRILIMIDYFSKGNQIVTEAGVEFDNRRARDKIGEATSYFTTTQIITSGDSRLAGVDVALGKVLNALSDMRSAYNLATVKEFELSAIGDICQASDDYSKYYKELEKEVEKVIYEFWNTYTE